MTLGEVSHEIAARLSRLFTPDEAGRRACHGDEARFADHPNWKDLVLFHEYFNGDSGKGHGASHQTGWTALITRCLEKVAAPHLSVGRPSDAMHAVSDEDVKRAR